VRDVNENLGSQLTAASQMSQQLKKQLAEGDNVVRRLSKIASAARPSSEAAPAAFRRPRRRKPPFSKLLSRKYRAPRRSPRPPRRFPNAEGPMASPHESLS
jgi:hypothetical protein